MMRWDHEERESVCGCSWPRRGLRSRAELTGNWPVHGSTESNAPRPHWPSHNTDCASLSFDHTGGNPSLLKILGQARSSLSAYIKVDLSYALHCSKLFTHSKFASFEKSGFWKDKFWGRCTVGKHTQYQCTKARPKEGTNLSEASVFYPPPLVSGTNLCYLTLGFAPV